MVEREIKNDEILRKQRASSAYQPIRTHSGQIHHAPQRPLYDQKSPTQTQNSNS